MPADVRIEGLDELRQHVERAVESLEADVREAALLAARDGIVAAQATHPYQDHREKGKSYSGGGAIGLTDTAHAEQRRVGSLRGGVEAEMVWPAPYAGFVNDGTSRSAPYPFTPIAVRHADYALEVYTERALENFRRAMGG